MNENIAFERRSALRYRTDLPIAVLDRSWGARGRGIDVSTSGLLVDWGFPVPADDSLRVALGLALHLPERPGALSAVVRSVWFSGSQQAFRFVQISDVDRLTVAEHLDALRLRGVAPS